MNFKNLNKTILIIILLIAGCKKDRYVLAYDVTIETSNQTMKINDNGNPSGCNYFKYKQTVKRGDFVSINFQSCGKGCQVKVYSGKKVWYDKTQFSHNEAIQIK